MSNMKTESNYNIYERGIHKNWVLKYAYKTREAFIARLDTLGQVNPYGEMLARRLFSHNGKEYRIEIFLDDATDGMDIDEVEEM